MAMARARRNSSLAATLALVAAVAALRCALELTFATTPAASWRRSAVFGTAARGSALWAPRVARGARGGEESFKAGDAVEAVFAEDGNWYPGVLVQANSDGTWEVKWDNPDGGPETSVCKLDEIKKYTPPIPLDQLEVGQKYTGTVVNTAPFGAFVNFGAEREGLVHVSCVKEGFVANIDDEVQAGQEVTVWVKDVRDGKVALTMVESKLSGRGGGGGGRRAPADLTPFQGLDGWLKGKVVSVARFGAFVAVSSGGSEAQGLVHVSEMSDGFVEDPNSIVSVGQEVDVRVTNVDLNAQKLSLSMKGAS